MLLGTEPYEVGSDGCFANRMQLESERYSVGRDGCLPNRMLLGTERCEVGSDGGRDGCSPHRMLLGTEPYEVGSDGCFANRMQLESERYSVGRDGCLPNRMLLGTERCEVGSDGGRDECSPHRMLLGTGQLPGRQRWLLFQSYALGTELTKVASEGWPSDRMLWEPDVTKIATSTLIQRIAGVFSYNVLRVTVPSFIIPHHKACLPLKSFLIALWLALCCLPIAFRMCGGPIGSTDAAHGMSHGVISKR